MKYYSVFSGVEAATLAWEPLGWEPLLFCEIDEFPSAVLKHSWPNVPNLGDIKAVNWKSAIKTFGRPDLIVGGSPCQSFSVAGTRTGLDGESGLMWEYVRAVRDVRPDWVLWENVPGALSSSNGEDFRCLLESLDALGYGLAWRVLDAQFFGVPQRRERLFLVGHLGEPGGACEVLLEPESLPWDLKSSREKRQELAGRAEGGAQSAGFKFHQGAGAGNIGYEEENSPTLTADYHNPAVMCMSGWQANSMMSDEISGTLTAHEARGGSFIVRKMTSECVPSQGVAQDYIVRRLTPRELERLQGMPDDHTKIPYRGKPVDECPDTPRYKAIGNSMCVNVMRWIGERIQKVDYELRTAQR